MYQQIERWLASGEPCTVLCIDVDHFALVNEQLGREAGDQVLAELAERIQSTVRSEDPVYHHEEDEFALVVKASAENAERIARDVVAAARRPIWVYGRPLSITVSIGSSSAAHSNTAAPALFRKAQAAMQHRKRYGRDGWCSAETIDGLSRPTGARDALVLRELYLDFQPQWSLSTCALRGFEALLRWKRRNGEQVSPGVFIPALEADGGIVAVGQWVAKEAIAQMAQWAPWLPTHARMSINASPLQLEGTELIDTLNDAFRNSVIDPSQVEVEVTETVLMPDSPAVASRLRALKD
ncbi:MAG: bifunctional diguanylate cyclase/phosphodiesterase, partial [Myxococcota bacterium]